jgi:hypothetical protein
MNNVFYTYAYLRKDGTPYYVGKGKGRRAFLKAKGEIKVPSEDRILFLKKKLTEEEAFRHEIYMIAMLGRKDNNTGILRNLTNGGEGMSGWKPSKETLVKIRESRKGYIHSKETKEKIGKGNKGKQRTQESRNKIAKSVEGFKWYNDGTQSIQAYLHPGEGWQEGRIFNWDSPRSKGMQWYHRDGKRKMFREDPGDGWIKGRPMAKGKKYYNNGTEHVLTFECPGDGWILGRLKRK